MGGLRQKIVMKLKCSTLSDSSYVLAWTEL